MTDKPHGRDCPDRCSICRGAPVRKVDQQADRITVDGVDARPIAAQPWSPGIKRSQTQKGGRR